MAEMPHPDSRPRGPRRAVRLLVVDDADRVLLFRDSDPGVPGARMWMTPGGGIDPDETLTQAAVRELREETGLTLSEEQLLGPLATRVVTHGFSDKVTDQHETFYLARVDAFDVDISGHTEDERLTVVGHRWWNRSDLAESKDVFWPTNLEELLTLAVSAQDWPVDFGTMEESTVPVRSG
jgi:8-oxo-dGTP pyrophosphatase MutT (NUDIX family)